MAKALAYAQRKGLMERIAQLEEANAQRDRLMDKIAQLEETGETLRAECYDLNGENPSLKSGTDEVVKAEVEYFRSHFEFTPDYENLQIFFVNFGGSEGVDQCEGSLPQIGSLRH
ncbi:hypothetical protein Fot_24777 [Forsythia ovata]|uniref:Uncharacterized protein n=1 Tax=Forsythia ovata TaxID=205694 RepID=A0ABD1U785_9LAMI